MPRHSFESELDLARHLARRAGAELMARYEAGAAGRPTHLAARRAAHRIIVDGLAAAYPRDARVSADCAEQMREPLPDRVWLFSALDGTEAFRARTGEFTVMIGLSVVGVSVLGAIFVVMSDVLYSAALESGAWGESGGRVHPIEARPADPAGLRLIVSSSQGEPARQQMQSSLDIQDVRVAHSEGAKYALIAEGACDLYLEVSDSLHEWDTCAPEAVIREAGGGISDCYGEPLRYGRTDATHARGVVAGGVGVVDSVIPKITTLYAAAYAR